MPHLKEISLLYKKKKKFLGTNNWSLQCTTKEPIENSFILLLQILCDKKSENVCAKNE